MYRSIFKIIIWSLFIILVIFFSRYFVVSFFFKIKTEDAHFVVFDEYIDSKILIIRDEEVISSDLPFVRLSVNDKSMIRKGQTLFLSYSSEKDLDDDFKILSQKNENKYLNNLGNINLSINQSIRKMQKEKKYNHSVENLVINRESIIKNQEFQQKCEEERPNFTEIKAESSGIFSSFVDGFENELSFNIDFNSINLKKYETVNQIDKNILGKIIKSNKCMILCNKKINNDNPILVTKNNEISCKLTKNGDNWSLFEADISNDLINARLENAKIKINSYEGFKISKKSIHNINGVDGVFTVDRKVLKFKPINIKYNFENVVICESGDEQNTLNENDIIVTSGKHLYDGKVLMYQCVG